ncbi:MAG: heavy metal translocating P-type ATPase [Pseudothermotoga sp.]|uniref:heavy metal translocating P-type ATPase n=1 Tax=Pseudothermotoga sp. TaxID=2033661 RepID=UPI0025892763|nr:heavy metal translocating P-type ATPase [Pseudothermotoga sp.]MDI6863804.1 heavy metal translocating P-type ATPase [Pseudothermotoga sp.]
MGEEQFKRTFHVTGMTCATCARIVEQALKKIDGVKFASVNLATSTGFILAEREIDFETIKKTVEAVGYGVETELGEDVESRRYAQAKKNLILVWLFTGPLMLFMLLHMFFHIPWLGWLEFVLLSFVIFFVGRKIMKGAWIAITHKHANMDVLTFLGALSAWMTGLLSMLHLPVASFAAVGAMIVAFNITGRFIESRLRDKASKQLKSLMQLQARQARVLFDSGEILLPIEAVKEGFVVIVNPSERVPVDGTIVEGSGLIDESMITGESVPVLKKAGDSVTAGSLNLTSSIKVQVTKVGEDTFLSQMIKLVQEAQGFKVPIQALADRITNFFVPLVFALAVFSAAFWYFNYERFSTFLEKMSRIAFWIVHTDEPLSFSIFVFVSTLVIACPCALGLATPMALLVGTTQAMKKGLLIRNAEAIQTAKDVRFVLTDKTGTLTLGEPIVVEHDLDEELLKIVASIEKKSNHPFAKAIAKLNEAQVEVQGFEEIVGEGVKAIVRGKEYFIGRPSDYSHYEEQLEQGRTIVEVRLDGEICGFLALEDKLREDAKEAVEKLKKMSIETIILTGDNERVARAVARKLGIDKLHAQLKPQEKLELVRRYQSFGKKVMMVGDGMNDAAALKAADIGVAMGSGTDIAMESADIVVVKGGIFKVVEAIEISKRTLKKIKQNLFWAFFYNVVAIPLAMAGLVHPLVAELAMLMSSISVVLNSLRMKEVKS